MLRHLGRTGSLGVNSRSVCQFTHNRQDNSILRSRCLRVILGVGVWGTWPEYLARGSDKIPKRVSKCDLIVTIYVVTQDFLNGPVHPLSLSVRLWMKS